MERVQNPQSYSVGEEAMNIYRAAFFCILILSFSSLTAENYIILGWNDLGMHCANKDFQNICILPPYNTLVTQVICVCDPPVDAGIILRTEDHSVEIGAFERFSVFCSLKTVFHAVINSIFCHGRNRRISQRCRLANPAHDRKYNSAMRC